MHRIKFFTDTRHRLKIFTYDFHRYKIITVIKSTVTILSLNKMIENHTRCTTC